MSRRTLSHFLNRDSDKKKKVRLQALFRTFLRRGSGKKIVPPLRGSDFLFSDFPHAHAWGSWDCAVPPALASATHETRKQNHHSAKNSPETFRRARIRVFNTHTSPLRRMRIRLFDTRARQGSSRGQKKRSRGKIRRERFMKPKRKRLKRRAVRRARLREPALLPLRERRILSPFWL